MRADLYLVQHGLIETRAKAQEAIAAGMVSADGQIVAKPSQKIAEGAVVLASPAHPYVSRAALKLVAGLDHFGVDPAGRTCLDVGSSTGGFTQVLLQRGAARVYAVDVGHGQLHPSLREDARVISMEGVDARSLTRVDLPEPPSLIVCDASFISLLKVIPNPMSLAANRADLVALIKPQFEVGRAAIGRGGLVKSARERDRAVADVRSALDGLADFCVRDVMESPVKGGDGNQEYLIAARRMIDPE
ncbi:TlyA family RNA methyltransferase [uncultured Maricaulis sp.]|uniref:TlyA family RNA methyltransferase n=1 Tax=uncultured Maricaulis sp. TaxID=174710 RepID=UPI0030DB8074|tara:strand:+ start:52212 stop:52949 length:738 start_codon:yes stop_codon:yes gene_type:complete